MFSLFIGQLQKFRRKGKIETQRDRPLRPCFTTSEVSLRMGIRDGGCSLYTKPLAVLLHTPAHKHVLDFSGL